MKIVYLDQNHWIELSRAAHGRAAKHGVREVLAAARLTTAAGSACFPVSFTHVMETHKNDTPDRRIRLAKFMLELSAEMTTADLPAVVRHEAHMALSRALPRRLSPPPPLQYLGRGLSHTAGRSFAFHLEWPSAAARTIPENQRKALEKQVLSLANLHLLSGTLPPGAPPIPIPPADLTPDRRFKAALTEWRGAAKRYSHRELERRIYAITFADVWDVLRDTLQEHNVPLCEFSLLGEPQRCRILDDMPSRKVDMHLRREWAKNPHLTPKESDLNDWASLGIAACYADVLVTEKQTADLLNRDPSTPATVIANLTELPQLLR